MSSSIRMRSGDMVISFGCSSAGDRRLPPKDAPNQVTAPPSHPALGEAVPSKTSRSPVNPAPLPLSCPQLRQAGSVTSRPLWADAYEETSAAFGPKAPDPHSAHALPPQSGRLSGGAGGKGVPANFAVLEKIECRTAVGPCL